jgi:hypothetical protein
MQIAFSSTKKFKGNSLTSYFMPFEAMCVLDLRGMKNPL